MTTIKSSGNAIREMLKCDDVCSLSELNGDGPPVVVEVVYFNGDERTSFKDGIILQSETMTAFVARYHLRDVNAMVMNIDAYTEWWNATDVEKREQFFDACRNILSEGWRCG